MEIPTCYDIALYVSIFTLRVNSGFIICIRFRFCTYPDFTPNFTHTKSEADMNVYTFTFYFYTVILEFTCTHSRQPQISKMCTYTRYLYVFGLYAYGVATISRLLKIIGLFCKRALYKRRYFAKETYDFKEPNNRSHPIWNPRITWMCTCKFQYHCVEIQS